MTQVTDQERVRRVVEEGSHRKRDLAAYERVKAGERRERMELAQVDPRYGAVVADLVRKLAEAVPESTFKIWLSELRCVGGDGSTLFLTAPEGIRTWVERRYSHLIREALQGTDYTDVEFVEAGGMAR